MVTLWSFFMPLGLATWAALWLSKHLFADRGVTRAIKQAREVILSEKELELAHEHPAVRTTMNLMDKAGTIFDFDGLVLNNMQNMLNLMGSKKRADKEFAKYLTIGFGLGLFVLVVPLLTGVWAYALLYPVGVVFAVYSQYQSLKKEYQLWQREVIKDLPGLIDKLRISFASGKDFRQAFREARDNSGPKMAAIIDKLNNDLQYMRPAQALDLFANSFKMPAVNKFASAVKISIEYGYQQAESYFNNIEADITEVRRVAIEEITRSKPEKVKELYVILIGLGVSTLLLKAWEIFSELNQLM